MILTLLSKAKKRTLSNLKFIKRHFDKKRLDAARLFEDFQFPLEFDATCYKKSYAELSQYDKDMLYAHYKNQGEKEGRNANLLKDRINFISLIPKNKKVLEIGPFFRPLTSGKNVFYFDVLNQEQLKLRAQELGFYKEKLACPKIDFVSPTGDLSIVNEKFDAILSSHCIEHQPNLIKHFNNIEKLLSPGGFYFLLIPDKRYCFDHFIPESNLARIIEAYIENRTQHTLGSVLEHRILTTHNESCKHWQGDHGTRYSSIKEKAEQAALEYQQKQSEGTYIDVHAWYFTPDSFKNILNALNNFSYSQLSIERIYPTLYKNNEFWVILKNSV